MKLDKIEIIRRPLVNMQYCRPVRENQYRINSVVTTPPGPLPIITLLRHGVSYHPTSFHGGFVQVSRVHMIQRVGGGREGWRFLTSSTDQVGAEPIWQDKGQLSDFIKMGCGPRVRCRWAGLVVLPSEKMYTSNGSF